MDEVDDTFKSCGGGGDETIGEGGVGLHSDTMMTQGFTPTDRYTPTSDHENKEVDHDNKQGDYDNKFIPVRHPLRPVAGLCVTPLLCAILYKLQAMEYNLQCFILEE